VTFFTYPPTVIKETQSLESGGKYVRVVLVVLTLVQKGVFFSGSKIYNHLPLYIKMQFEDAKRFRSILKTFLTQHAFYILNRYYQLTPQ
jgi:Mlc titration factor MtfA (ptsG expression regulator)